MSQWGADGYAQRGWGYRRILSHYYPHTRVGTATDQPIRVLLADRENAITVGSAKPFLLIDSSGQTIHIDAGALRLTGTLDVDGHALIPPLTVEPGAQPVSLNGAGYRGSLVVDRIAGTLSVVNTVPLERYVRGVVPSEMPSDWAAAAYEAQAVAARSYALANLHPANTFDVYADNRSQVYGGIRSERVETDLAVGATAGEVLTYDDRVIAAYYDSDSGGRTAAVQDIFPTDSPEPYLVSVPDPFDGASPYRRWQVILPSTVLSRRFDIPVSDVRVQLNPSGRASNVRLLARHMARTLTAATFQSALELRSTYFTIGVALLKEPTSKSLPGQPVRLRGFLRDVSGVILQKRSPSGKWTQVAPLVSHRNGRFLMTVRPEVTTAYRLTLDDTAGQPITATVAETAPRHKHVIPSITAITVNGP
jgi:stage II sporulation protein D